MQGDADFAWLYMCLQSYRRYSPALVGIHLGLLPCDESESSRWLADNALFLLLTCVQPCARVHWCEGAYRKLHSSLAETMSRHLLPSIDLCLIDLTQRYTSMFRIYCNLLYSPRPAYIQGHSIANIHWSRCIRISPRYPRRMAIRASGASLGIRMLSRTATSYLPRSNLAHTVIVDGAT